MKRTLTIIALAGTLAACETVGPPPPPPPPTAGPAVAFNPRDFAWSTQAGSSAIRGEVAYAQGSLKFTCSGQPVILTPDTPFSRSRIVSLYGSAERAALPVAEVRSRQAARPSDDYSAFVRRATCDGADRFAFQGLPAGGWYVIVVAQPRNGGASVAVMRHVVTRPGVVRQVVIQ